MSQECDDVNCGYTLSLLALDSCTPVSAQVHDAAWARIVTPLLAGVWERELAMRPDRSFSDCV